MIRNWRDAAWLGWLALAGLAFWGGLWMAGPWWLIGGLAAAAGVAASLSLGAALTRRYARRRDDMAAADELRHEQALERAREVLEGMEENDPRRSEGGRDG